MSYDEKQQATIESICNENDARMSDFLRDGNDPGKIFFSRIGMLMSAIECAPHKDHCDSPRTWSNFKQSPVLTTSTGEHTVPTNKYLSEENNYLFVSSVECEDNYFVTNIECSGSYCDNKKLQCRKLMDSAGIYSNNSVTHWTDWGWSSAYIAKRRETCKTDYYVIGMQCRFSYCGSIKLKCRKIEVRI